MSDVQLGYVTGTLSLPESSTGTLVPVTAAQSVTFTPAQLMTDASGRVINNPATADFINGALTYQGNAGIHLYPGSWTASFIPSVGHADITLYVLPGQTVDLLSWDTNTNVLVPTKGAEDGDLLNWDGTTIEWVPPTGIKGIGTAAFHNVSEFATAAQGSKADTALQQANYDTVKASAEAAQASAAQSAVDAQAAQNAATGSQSGAATSAANAAASATAASNSAGTATTAATAASNSAGNATTAATAANTSATNAKTSETNAKTSETNAKTSETGAATSATHASASASAAASAVSSIFSFETETLTGTNNASTPSIKVGSTVARAADTTVTFGAAFAHSINSVILTNGDSGANASGSYIIGTTSAILTGFHITTAGTLPTRVNWIAIGS